MKLLITGASGFVGRATVEAAVRAGHDVMAMVRPAADPSAFAWPPGVQILRGDLRRPGAWTAFLSDVEAVIHLAAAPSGDLSTQFAGTVIATENLLKELPLTTLRRFVHVSSFSVYDFHLTDRRGLNEATPLEAHPEQRDAYTITKMLQEKLVRETCQAAGTSHVVIRPGAIFGPGKLWGFGSAISIGRHDLIFSPYGKMRLTFVENCAEALVSAVTAAVPSGSTYNVIDDDLPTHIGFHRMCRNLGLTESRAVPVPWGLVVLLGLSASLASRLFFKGRARLPEILALRRQKARWRPLRYSNELAKRQLGWAPRLSIQQALRDLAAAPALPGQANALAIRAHGEATAEASAVTSQRGGGK